MKYLMVVYFHLQYFQQIPSYQVQNLDFASDWIQCLVLIKWLCFIRRGWIQRNVIITYTEVPILGIHPIYLGIRKWKLKSRKLTSPSPFDFKLSAKHVWIVRKHFWLILGWKIGNSWPTSIRSMKREILEYRIVSQKLAMFIIPGYQRK